MTTLGQRPGRARRPPQRRRRWPRLLGYAAALIIAFVLGLSLGKALNDGPKRGHMITSVQTISPVP